VPTNDVWEINTRSFVIRLWIEEPATESQKATWRGYISHVGPEGALGGGREARTAGGAANGAGASGTAPGARRYVQDLAEITEFLAAFLRQMGVEL
jgi:hypothetical protein